MAAKSGDSKTKGGVKTERLWVHLALALFTVVGCQFALLTDRSGVITEPLTLGLGYVALFYLGLSLVIGPLYLARRRRNPVNIYLRRDIGIWAGITALLHVLLGFQIFEKGQILLYFFSDLRGRLLPQLNLFGLSNDVGLLAAIIIFVLLVLSNDISLRRLKGKRWKLIQRLTYPLLVLSILHTLGYQLYNERDQPFILALVGFTLVVALAQGAGVRVHLRRQATRTQTPAGAHPALAATAARVSTLPARPGTAPYLVPEAEPAGLSRRRFLVFSGAALLTGLAAVISFRASEEIVAQMTGGPPALPAATAADGTDQTAPTATTEAPAPEAAAPTTTTAAPAPEAAAPTATTPAPAPEAAAPTATTAAPALEAAAPTATTVPAPEAAQPPTAAPSPTTPAAAGGSTSNEVVLATVTSCPVNSAVNFTTPDTGETAILVHEADGSVRAFSNLCTHRPYPVEFDAGSQLLVCPLHLACFNARTGDVTQGPARSPLTEFPVHIDKQGNIVYG